MKLQTKLFIGCISLCVVLAGAAIWHFESIRMHGQQVILETRPVDPRDILRGDYVVLRYAIASNDTLDVFLDHTAQEQKTEGTPIYILLSLKDTGHIADFSYSWEQPESGTYIRGETSSSWRQRIELGIEQYFVPENKGWEVERMQDLQVKIALSARGQAQILELLHAGEPVDFSKIDGENPRKIR